MPKSTSSDVAAWLFVITKTCPFKYTENFTTKKRKFSDIFHISAQNIDCGYSLEPLSEAVLTSTTIYVFEQK